MSADDEAKSPEGFAQMPRWLQRSKDVSPWAKLVYLALSSRMDKHGQAHPSHRLLAEECSCSIPTVKRALDELRQLGVITWAARRLDNESQTSNLYTVGVAAAPSEVLAGAAPQVSQNRGQVSQIHPPVLTDPPPGSHRSTNESQVNESQVNELPLIEPDEDVDNSTEPAAGPIPTIEEMFDAVWEAWPRKVDKRDARKAFVKALVKIHGNRPEATEQLVTAIHAWKRQWFDVEQRTIDKIPHFATWLNAERWTDEIPDLDVRALAPNHPAVRARPQLPPAPVVKNHHCPHGYWPGARRPDDGSIEVCPHADCPTNTRAAGGHR